MKYRINVMRVLYPSFDVASGDFGCILKCFHHAEERGRGRIMLEVGALKSTGVVLNPISATSLCEFRQVLILSEPQLPDLWTRIIILLVKSIS